LRQYKRTSAQAFEPGVQRVPFSSVNVALQGTVADGLRKPESKRNIPAHRPVDIMI
jgi:hypothetical protein